MTKPVLLLAILLLFVANAAQATTFEGLLEKIKNHPQVDAILAESEQRSNLAEGALGLPDPTISLGIDNVPVNDPGFDRFLPTSKVIGFSQTIPSYSLRKANSEKQEVLSKQQQLMADYTYKRLKAILIAMLVKHHQIKQQQDYAKQQLARYQELENYFKGKLEAGNGVYWRFSEVDVERSLVEQRLNDLKAEQDSIEAELIRLVGEVPDTPLPDIPHHDWDQQPNTLFALQIARENIMAAEKEVDAARAGYTSNYGVSALYKQRESGRNFAGDDWFSLQATISIPLWYEQNQKPKLQAAKAGKRSATQAYHDMLRTWIQQMTALASKRDATLANIKLLVGKEKALDEMVAAADRNYESGATNLDTVLDAQINRLNISAQLAEQRARHLMLVAEYNSHIIGEQK